MYRSVLQHRDLIRWAEERVVPLVAHNELGHEETRTEGTGGVVERRCTLYPGLRCRDHLDAAVDVDNARGEDLVKVPFLELCPNTWLVGPTGEVLQIEDAEQFDPAKVRARVEALQKDLGPSLASKDLNALREALSRADDAVDGERWKDALTGLAELEKAVQAPHAALRRLIQARLDAIEEDVAFAFEAARDDGAAEAKARKDRVRGILEAIDVVVLGQRIPSYRTIEAWLGDC